MEAVLPAVIADELEHVISLLTSLPENLMEKINIDDVFEQLAQKIFFNGVSMKHFFTVRQLGVLKSFF